jgi:hypothetical protein
VDLVLFAAGAMVDRFSCRLDQVDVHLSFFQTHGLTFIFIASFNLKYEALNCPKRSKSASFKNDEKKGILFAKTF